jgi:tRNA pseudouridine55 synthase
MKPSPKTTSTRPEVTSPHDRRQVDGVLLLNKPRGLSSNAALQRAKRLYRAQKAGHTGTLDPLACGLLPICFGDATKFAQAVLDADKTYVASIRLGATTTTGDTEGAIVASRPVTASPQDVESALKHFVGRIFQVPPRHAALKRDGRKYYEYARAGVEIARHPREVDIHELELTSWRPPEFDLRVRCGKGAYIRALAEDIGSALGCGAHLTALVRTAAGGFVLDDAFSPEALEQRSESERDALLLPVDALVAGLARLDLGNVDAVRLAHGQAVTHTGLRDGVVRIYAGGSFAGIASIADGIVRARRLIAQSAGMRGAAVRN